MFYYFFHHSLPESSTFTEGRRNCATFLYGSFMYCVLYVIVKNLRMRFGQGFDPVLAILLPLWIADAGVMGFVYRSHYGRSILHEIPLDDDDSSKWVYDAETHKYVRPEGYKKENKKEKKEKATDEPGRVFLSKIGPIDDGPLRSGPHDGPGRTDDGSKESLRSGPHDVPGRTDDGSKESLRSGPHDVPGRTAGDGATST